jgi:hypothetical protein
VVVREGDRLPPVPRLQTTPIVDLTTFRAAQVATVESWEWVDREAGIARVPVSRAIEILAKRGLPATPAASPVPPPGAAGAGQPAPGAAPAAAAAGGN